MNQISSTKPNKNLVPLSKYLAQSGVASRRRVVEYIKDGFVTINKRVCTNPAERVDPSQDQVSYNNKVVKAAKAKIYIMFNKPAGVISSTTDNYERETVLDLIKAENSVSNLKTQTTTDLDKYRLYPVGRLDQDSRGLMIITNDGELSQKLSHPKHTTSKDYLVTVKGKSAVAKLEQLNKPVQDFDGKMMVAKVVVAPQDMPKKYNLATKAPFGENTTLQFTLHQGKKRQIRKICAENHLFVLDLLRIRVEDLELEDLPSGKWRYLTKEEVSRLLRIKA